MPFAEVDEAIALLEKANANFEPELLVAEDARWLLDYGRARKLVDFAIASLTRKISDAATVAKATGTSVGRL